MKNLLFISILLGLIACQKQDIEVPEFSPVFFISADIDGDQKELKAGVQSYFMHTDILEENGLFISRSVLTSSQAEESHDGIIGLDINYPDDDLLTEEFSTGRLSFRHEGSKSIVNNITTDTDFSAPVQTTLRMNNTVHRLHANSIEYHQTEVDTLQLSYLLDEEGLISFTQVLRTSFENPYSVMVIIEDLGDGTYDISVEADIDQYNVLWSDGKLSTMRSVPGSNVVIGRLAAPGLEPIEIRVHLPASGLSGNGHVGFKNIRHASEVALPVNIDLWYENNEGTRYRTRYHEQPSSSAFNIEKIEPYKPNDKGQMTYKVMGSFEATLKNRSEELVHIKARQFVLAIVK